MKITKFAEVVKLENMYKNILWQNQTNLPLLIRFASASKQFIRWLHQEIKKELNTKGFIADGKRDENLTFGINDSLKLLNYMYYSPNIICLSRKFQKAKPYFKRT